MGKPVKFRVGDKVKFNENSKQYGYTGTIILFLRHGTPVVYSVGLEEDKRGHNANGIIQGKEYGCWSTDRITLLNPSPIKEIKVRL